MNSLLVPSVVAAFTLAVTGCTGEIQNLGGAGGDGGSGGSGGGATNTPGGQGGSGAQGASNQGGDGGQGGYTQGGSGGEGGSGGGDGIHYARFTFKSGQETIGDFCVSTMKDASGAPYWQATGLLASNGIFPAEFDGLQKMTAYLPLPGAPIAFGFSYPGKTCASGPVAVTTAIPTGVDYFTVVAVPYSFEPIVLWAVGDPITTVDLPDPPPGFRIVNATLNSYPIEVESEIQGNQTTDHGLFDFGNSPTDYIDVGSDHLWGLFVKEQGDPDGVTFDFAALDLLPLQPRHTIYVSGTIQNQATALACPDAITGDFKSSACFLVKSAP